MPGLAAPSIDAITSVDLDALRSMSMKEVLGLIRQHGIRTQGIESVDEAVKHLVDRLGISGKE